MFYNFTCMLTHGESCRCVCVYIYSTSMLRIYLQQQIFSLICRHAVWSMYIHVYVQICGESQRTHIVMYMCALNLQKANLQRQSLTQRS